MPNINNTWVKRYSGAFSTFNKHPKAMQRIYSFKIGLKYDPYEI